MEYPHKGLFWKLVLVDVVDVVVIVVVVVGIGIWWWWCPSRSIIYGLSLSSGTQINFAREDCTRNSRGAHNKGEGI